MRLRERFSAAVKAFNGGDWASTSLPGNVGVSRGRSVWVPGTRINWDNVTGDIIGCPAAQACFNYIYRNLPQAPPVIRQKNREGEAKPVPGHPVTSLLMRPNPQYDGATLLNQAAFSLHADGNAYIVIERTRGGEIAELHWWPHHWVTTPADTKDVIEKYVVRDMQGYLHEVPAEDIIHLKWGLNPEDWRFGLSPLAAATRGIFSLQMSANYRANILRNFGTVGALIRPKDAVSAQDAEFDPETVARLWADKVSGDNVGKALILDWPADVDFPGVSPQNMAIETMDDRPEADICALFGLPPQVVGLHVGRLSKTYANYAEARESAWEECLMPLGGMLACQFGYKLIPEFESGQKVLDTYALGFDYANVRPLQPDKDKLHERAREDFKVGLLTLGEWCAEVGRPAPPPDMAEMRYSDLNTFSSGTTDNMTTDGTQAGQTATATSRPRKDLDWAARVIGEIEALHAESALTGAERNGAH